VNEATAASRANAVRVPVEVVLPLPYYAILFAELIALSALYRVRPTTAGDPVGHGIGWVGTASMCIMHVYSLRKRVRAWSRWGRLRTWLQFHIFMGLQGALLVTFHSLHLATLVNLSGLTLLMTLIVVASGIFGRYLYSFIPKGLSGERLSAIEVEKELTELASLLARSAHPDLEAAMAEYAQATTVGKSASLAQLVREDVQVRRALRHVDRAIANAVRSSGESELEQFAAGLRRRVLLTRRLAMLTVAERLFRNWTILHKPLTYLLGGSVLLHIVAHYIYSSRFSG
jgi:hypothetical protein